MEMESGTYMEAVDRLNASTASSEVYYEDGGGSDAGPTTCCSDYPDGSGTSLPSSSVELYPLTSRAGELVVIGLVLMAWLLSVAVFLHRWRHLRILPPRALFFKGTAPKNIDRVRVVERPADSVIYRGYPMGVASALQARFNRIKRTFSKRLTNLPLAMTSVRHRPSLGRPSFYGRPGNDGRKCSDGRPCSHRPPGSDERPCNDGRPSCNNGRQSCYGRPVFVGRHRASTFYRAPRWSRPTELTPALAPPEAMEPIPEAMQTIPEVETSGPEVTQRVPDLVVSRSGAMKSASPAATSIPEVATSRPEVCNSRPELITSLAEVVIEFAQEEI